MQMKSRDTLVFVYLMVKNDRQSNMTCVPQLSTKCQQNTRHRLTGTNTLCARMSVQGVMGVYLRSGIHTNTHSSDTMYKWV